MTLEDFALSTLRRETRALGTRLARVRPFALTMPMVWAAGVPADAKTAVERHLCRGRRELRTLLRSYLRWLAGAKGRKTAAEAQRRFSFLKLKFNVVLTQFDIFADVFTQRGEHGHGVWLAGLDALAADALALPGGFFEPPPVVTYLDRGHGAAIRRARTRLPGGGKNPVTVIRIPRERMVGSGIAASLVHEVGHQGAAFLGLVPSLRRVLQAEQRRWRGDARCSWFLWERWISEIVADFWALARLGVVATQGLMGVMSLPRPFVFRIDAGDPHPAPWIRVKLSTAAGAVLFPHSQWRRLSRLWESFYPKTGLDARRQRVLRSLEVTLPRLIRLLAEHRPASLGGASLVEALAVAGRRPQRLRSLYLAWRETPRVLLEVPPTLALAVLGQARQDGALEPREESRMVAKLLNHWALRQAPAGRPARVPKTVAKAA